MQEKYVVTYGKCMVTPQKWDRKAIAMACSGNRGFRKSKQK